MELYTHQFGVSLFSKPRNRVNTESDSNKKCLPLFFWKTGLVTNSSSVSNALHKHIADHVIYGLIYCLFRGKVQQWHLFFFCSAKGAFNLWPPTRIVCLLSEKFKEHQRVDFFLPFALLPSLLFLSLLHA